MNAIAIAGVSALALLAAAAIIRSPSTAIGLEQPTYEVVERHGDWELRSYAPSIEARVTVEGPWEVAIRSGFRVLGGYIFGGNRPQEEIAMTAPVAAQRASSGVEIAMTAPVAAQANPDGPEQWTVSFTMPSRWTLATLPAPNDPRVELVEVAPRRVAALRFNAWATEERVAERTAQLEAALDAAGLAHPDAPVVAQYNPPWTPPPFRRNEILIAVGGE